MSNVTSIVDPGTILENADSVKPSKASKDSKDTYNAVHRGNLLFFDPLTLVLVDDPNHPLFDKRVHLPVDKKMVQNILQCGILEPILVRKNGETGKIEVVAGRQRVKATIEANKLKKERGEDPITIPGIVRRGDDVSQMTAMVSENEQREQDTPLGRAHKMAALINRGRTEQDLSIMFRCSVQTIKNNLALLELTDVAKKAVDTGAVSVANGYELTRLTPEAQREAVAKMIQVSPEAPSAGQKVRGKAKKQRQAVGKHSSPVRGKREVLELKHRVEKDSTDPAFKAAVLPVLEWFLRERAEVRVTRAK